MSLCTHIFAKSLTLLVLLIDVCYARAGTIACLNLPPSGPPAPHWPWWLRLLALVGVFIFIRVVAGLVRNSGRPQA